MANSPSSGRILPLTSARFLAALYVVIEHGAGIMPALQDPSSYWAKAASLGYVAVNFFFVLSGYILAMVYVQGPATEGDASLPPPNRKVVARKFFWARIARVYPVYVACLLLDLPHFVHSKHLDVLAGDPQQHAGVAATLGVNLLLLQGWFTHFMGINGPGWSLSNEAFFYALFPLVAAPLCRLRMRQAMAAMAAVYVAGNLAVVGFGYLHPDPATWRYFPALHWFEFLIGILSARLHVCWSQSERGRVRLRQAAPWMLAGSFAAFAAAVPLQQLVSLQLLAHGVFTPLFCCAVLALAAGNRWLEMLFAPAWFCLLGEASYSLYLLHVPVFFLLRSRLAAHGNLFPLYCLLCIGLSVASYLWLEKPCRRWILKFARQRGLESEAAAAIAQ